jgi:peptidoglycan/LPS O-acetylase OafA/YrhL
MKRSAYLIDFIFVLIFVTIGRHTHKDGNPLTGTFTTLWPFAVGLLVGWVVVSRTRRVATARSSGLILALSAVVVGMVLRVISGQGIALTFVIVASAFLSFCLVGWRVLLSLRK